ncbi:response regulator [uncultured Cohaesibacter sp.]|uniref:response regulator n=1 Tax=uncultured Cohaesibacter sp. TaxID=1002546 RepID=UPI0029C95DE5|nr:response regulator [uncultured Cohaesibacter sp.]
MPSESPSVLIANPNGEDAAALGEVLKAVDITLSIDLVKGGTACLEAVSNKSYDLCFINTAFLDLDCFSVLTKIRELKNRPLCILTSDQYDLDIVEKAKLAGVYDCILKPYRPEDIERFMRRLEIKGANFPVLIADDSRVTRRVIFKVLEECNFNLTVSEASSGQLAIALCKKILFRFMFIDYSMPQLNGLEAAKKMLKSCPGSSIVLITATGDPKVQEEAVKAGLAGFLQKPFLPHDIDQLLHSLLGLEQPNIHQEAFLKAIRNDGVFDELQDNLKQNYLLI